MFDKLEQLEKKYEELTRLLSDEKIINQPSELQKHAKAQSEIEEIVMTFREYKRVLNELDETKELLEDKLDAEMKEMAELEYDSLTEKKEQLESELKILLLPKDPNDEKNVIMEIRAGAGGDEAALFAADLFRMYTRYAEAKGWKTEILSSNYTDINGIKEISFSIEGKGAYSKLKFESGVHRVQRVPTTESGGRIHLTPLWPFCLKPKR